MPTLHYQSARGIYYDIQYSHFTCEVKDLVFYFTSEFNLTRFEERYLEEIEEFNQKINRLYWNNHDLKFDELALIRFYMKIEKRGFLISYKGEKITCQESITFKIAMKMN